VTYHTAIITVNMSHSTKGTATENLVDIIYTPFGIMPATGYMLGK